MSGSGGMSAPHDYGAIVVRALRLTDPAEGVQQPFHSLPPHSTSPIVVIAGHGIRIPSHDNIAISGHGIDSAGIILKTAEVDHAFVCVPAETVGLPRSYPSQSHDHGAVRGNSVCCAQALIQGPAIGNSAQQVPVSPTLPDSRGADTLRILC